MNVEGGGVSYHQIRRLREVGEEDWVASQESVVREKVGVLHFRPDQKRCVCETQKMTSMISYGDD